MADADTGRDGEQWSALIQRTSVADTHAEKEELVTETVTRALGGQGGGIETKDKFQSFPAR